MEKRIEEMNKTTNEIKEIANNSFKDVEENINRVIQQKRYTPDTKIDLGVTLRNMDNVTNLIKLMIVAIIIVTVSTIVFTTLAIR